MNTLKTDADFESARTLVMSYGADALNAPPLPKILMEVRELFGLDAFNRLLVLAAAVQDSRFNEYGLADVLPLLRSLAISNDIKTDVETLLTAMRDEHAALELEARRKAAEDDDPYRKAAIRLLTKFRSPNMAQIERELTRL